MTTDAFWGLTLRQFALLAARHEQRMKQEDRRAGEVAAMIFNANCDRSEYPNGITWLEIFPGWKELKVQTEDELFENMMAWGTIGQPTDVTE